MENMDFVPPSSFSSARFTCPIPSHCLHMNNWWSNWFISGIKLWPITTQQETPEASKDKMIPLSYVRIIASYSTESAADFIEVWKWRPFTRNILNWPILKGNAGKVTTTFRPQWHFEGARTHARSNIAKRGGRQTDNTDLIEQSTVL